MPMFVEFPTETSVTAKTLQEAYQVCNQCGTKYGEYSVGCSSHWTGKCDVCGKTKSVTESRDYGYLEKGILKVSKETLAEDAEDFLYDRDIELTSHSYENIIAQAQQHGFRV
jgi:predicted ATP-dependent serine protease